MRCELLLILAGATLLSACRDASAGTGWTTDRETLPNGVVQVTNVPPAVEQPAWQLDEELRIGSLDGAGPTSFGQIKGLVVDGSGRIIVLDAQSQDIRVFGPDGAHLVTHGRRGGGPGEYQNALGLMRTSDGLLYVPDQRNARMNVVDVERGFLRSYPLTLYMWGFVWDGVMREDDHVVVRSMSLETRRDLLRVYDREMVQVDSVLLPERPPITGDPPGAYAWEAPGGMPRGFVQIPFYASGGYTLDASGDAWSAFGGDPTYRVARFRPGGDTTLIIRTQRQPVPVTAAERDSALNAIVERLQQYGVRSLDAARVPATKPGVLALFSDDRGRLWVETSSPDTLRRYDVYDPDGSYAGSFATPLQVVRYVTPVVRGDSFYAVVTDEMDVQYVVRAGLVRDRRREP